MTYHVVSNARKVDPWSICALNPIDDRYVVPNHCRISTLKSLHVASDEIDPRRSTPKHSIAVRHVVGASHLKAGASAVANSTIDNSDTLPQVLTPAFPESGVISRVSTCGEYRALPSN